MIKGKNNYVFISVGVLQSLDHGSPRRLLYLLIKESLIRKKKKKRMFLFSAPQAQISLSLSLSVNILSVTEDETEKVVGL